MVGPPSYDFGPDDPLQEVLSRWLPEEKELSFSNAVGILHHLNNHGYGPYLATHRVTFEEALKQGPLFLNSFHDGEKVDALIDRSLFQRTLENIHARVSTPGFNWELMQSHLRISEPALIIEYEEHQTSHDGHGRTVNVQRNKSLDMMVIQNLPTYHSQDRQLTIPTNTIVTCRDFLNPKWEQRTGPFTLGFLALHAFGKPVYHRSEAPTGENFRHGTFVLSGNDVSHYFEFPFVRPEAGRAYELLGITAPESIRQRYATHLLSQKVRILTALEEIVPAATQTRGRINVQYSRNDDFVSSPADAFFASGRDRETFGRQNGNIQNHLQQAIELGMHTEQTPIEIHPGVLVTPTTYLQPLFERYQITIPAPK